MTPKKNRPMPEPTPETEYELPTLRESDGTLEEDENGFGDDIPSSIVFFDTVSKRFPGGFSALEDVTLSIDPGEFIFLVGASGAGKSSLLRLIYAESTPSEGTVFFDGRDLSTIKRKHLPYFRRNIGTVFQDFKLLPQKTAFENVAYALEVYGKPTDDILAEVPEILDIAGLSAKADLYPRELSGGEQQRVAIARALILQPRMIIADEPTGNLDPHSADAVLDLLTEINELGTTVIFATHNQGLVDRIGKRVVTLDEGHIASDEQGGKYRLPERRHKKSV
jgi:cell division transport system ATP-binding protein